MYNRRVERARLEGECGEIDNARERGRVGVEGKGESWREGVRGLKERVR